MTPVSEPFVFGIYPGGGAGSDSGLTFGPEDDSLQIESALNLLQGDASTFIVRCYERFSDTGHPSRWPRQTPRDYSQYARNGRLLDLVVMFQSQDGDVNGFLKFMKSLLQEHGPRLYSIQITEEANFSHGPDCIDGPWPRVLEALVEGVQAAKEEALSLGLRELRIGFNTTATFGAASEFWTTIGNLGGKDFARALDYVGLDFFPDTFRPAADIRSAVLGVVETMRSTWLPAAGIPDSVPIHIAEHGWPTGPDRSEHRQARVFEEVVRTLVEARERLNLRRYTAFCLRDSESFKPEHVADMFYHFGLMRSDYTPKPAFETYRRLIAGYFAGAERFASKLLSNGGAFTGAKPGRIPRGILRGNAGHAGGEEGAASPAGLQLSGFGDFNLDCRWRLR
jgi:hypothetical protein